MRLCRGRTCPARGLPASTRLPYTAGPGMPGPYGTATIKNRLFALCIVGWGLDRSLQSNGKQAFSCSQNKKRAAPFAWGPRGMC